LGKKVSSAKMAELMREAVWRADWYGPREPY